jgi:hypothetical protein
MAVTMIIPKKRMKNERLSSNLAINLVLSLADDGQNM